MITTSLNAMPETWRLIPPLEASGRMQMSIDIWLLEKHRQGEHPPCLRFYTWPEATISLGYHQHQYPDFWDKLTWEGKKLAVIRRPSGGRAVLHQGDLTYMVVTSGLSTKRREAYRDICQFLIQGWQQLGLSLEYGNAGKDYIQHSNCFATASTADLVTSRGDKLIGSAQLRRGETILQHGSMLYSTSNQLFTKVFPDSNPRNIQNYLSLTNTDLFTKVIPTLTETARSYFQIDLQERPLTDEERAEILIDLSRF
jgi:lipoate---protein ligase